ncbi:hypothetical protein [Roseomonas sp. 18066]|uniref:hypothetical protein n=1 Tax=Roseomonas sp. 18066 TaxID=2681412 RepID=UPI00135C19F7|nr:hypothetical protein [Roseomonas sp. 18066]
MASFLLRCAAHPVLAHLPLILAGNLALLALAWLLALLLEAAAGLGVLALALGLPLSASLLAVAVTALAGALPDAGPPGAGGTPGWPALRWPTLRWAALRWAALLGPPAALAGLLLPELVALCLDGAPLARLLAGLGLGALLPGLLFLLYLLPADLAGGAGPAWRRSGLMVFRHGPFALGAAVLALLLALLSAGLLPGIGGALMLLRGAVRQRLGDGDGAMPGERP